MKRALVIPLFCALSALAGEPPAVAYPDGYRDWVHVKSMIIHEGHPLFDAFGGIHHIYANRRALASYRRGGPFVDGATIVFDLLEANEGNGAIVEGRRKVVGVMTKDSRKWPDTGGWGFEGFKGESRTDRAVGTNAASACFGCHAPQKETDYTFSRWRP